jgi:hypothetical protein
MATKFGYVERNLENDVNWAQVGKGFSDMLLAERDEREAKKGNLDDLMAKTQEGLRNTPLGYNTTFNDQMVGLGANSSAFVLAANKDLKAGRITPEDYMRKLHRVNSSADTTFALANSYNEIYEDKLTRMDDKTSGNVEQAAFEAMSNLVDFNKHDFMIDQDGTIVAAPLITDENGITTLDTKNAKSVQAIFNLAQNKVDRLDVEGVISESVEMLGNKVLGTSVAASRKKEGMNVLIEGIKLADKPAYDKWKASQIDRMMVDDLDTASILTDYSSDYETTTDKKKWLANKDKYIYVDIDNGKEILIGELTEKQKEDAIDILDGVIESQVGGSRTEETTSKVEASWSEKQFWWTNAQNETKNQTTMNQLAVLYGGAEGDMKPAIAYFKGLNKNLHDIERSSTGTTVVIRDPKTNKLLRSSVIPFGTSFDMYAKSATALTGIKDANKTLKSLDFTNVVKLDSKGMPTFQEYKGKTFKNPDEADESGDSYTQFSAHLNNKIKIGSSSAAITSALSGTGYEVKDGKLMMDGKAVGTRTYDLSNSQDIEDLKTEVLSDKTAAASYLTAKKIKGNPTEGMTTAEIIEFYTQD